MKTNCWHRLNAYDLNQKQILLDSICYTCVEILKMKNCKLQSQVKNSQEVKDRAFEVVVYEQDYKEICSWVLRHENIETGGDLFGLWSDDRRAVVQLVLGPGQNCTRTTCSFYQDVEYLKEVGSYVTTNEGMCHIGEWHSHHQHALARPSGGDENTVWNNMPTYGLDKFVIFIANIETEPRRSSATVVTIGCFLFEYETRRRSIKQMPVLPGRFTILPGENPFGKKIGIRSSKEKQAEGVRMSTRESDLIRCEYMARGVVKGVREQQEYKKHSDKQDTETDRKKKRRQGKEKRKTKKK